VPHDIMTDGAFDYEIEVWDRATELATKSETFFVAGSNNP
jgi:hypothetical protein